MSASDQPEHRTPQFLSPASDGGNRPARNGEATSLPPMQANNTIARRSIDFCHTIRPGILDNFSECPNSEASIMPTGTIFMVLLSPVW